jgi:hypothetical protein
MNTRDRVSKPVDEAPLSMLVFCVDPSSKPTEAPAEPKAPQAPASYSITHLPPEVQERIRMRAEIADKAKAAYWEGKETTST